MADNPVLDRVSGFAAQPVTRQLSLLAGFAASIALAIGVVNWASTPSYEPRLRPNVPGGQCDSYKCFTNQWYQIPYGAGNGTVRSALRRCVASAHGLGQ